MKVKRDNEFYIAKWRKTTGNTAPRKASKVDFKPNSTLVMKATCRAMRDRKLEYCLIGGAIVTALVFTILTVF